MKPIKSFESFIKSGIVKRQAPDISRANFLRKESEKSYLSLNKIVNEIGLNDDNASTIIKLCYDIVMELIRAKMFIKGFNSSGKGAHEAEVVYLRELGFNENDVQSMNELRYFRNGVVYYGKILDKHYAEKVLKILEKIYPKLKQ